MSTSITVRRYLDKQDVPYSVITCPVDKQGRWQGDIGDISPFRVARAMILKDINGMVMAVLPITHRLKLDALNRQLHRKLKPAEESDFRGVFADCSPGILPALGEAYNFETVIDDSLLDQDFVYVASGNAGELGEGEWCDPPDHRLFRATGRSAGDHGCAAGLCDLDHRPDR